MNDGYVLLDVETVDVGVNPILRFKGHKGEDQTWIQAVAFNYPRFEPYVAFIYMANGEMLDTREDYIVRKILERNRLGVKAVVDDEGKFVAKLETLR
jgi:hypothetical protein